MSIVKWKSSQTLIIRNAKLGGVLCSQILVPIAAPYQSKAYDNLQQMLNYDNAYDEPMALPVKYQYPRYMADERRKRGATNKNLFR